MTQTKSDKKGRRIAGGVASLSIIILTLVGLKIGKIITWSWWWVLTPVWLVNILIIGTLLVHVIRGCNE